MFHKIKKVKPLANYLLEITFQDNTIKNYDVSKVFEKWPIFQILISKKGLFEKVKVEPGGYGISWNTEIDLSCNELWDNGFMKK